MKGRDPWDDNNLEDRKLGGTHRVPKQLLSLNRCVSAWVRNESDFLTLSSKSGMKSR